MSASFLLTRKSRENYLKILDSFTSDHLNTVPIGFNNNIIWNIAHVVATYEILCYKLNNIPMHLDALFVDEYKKGTHPQKMVDDTFIQSLKKTMMEQLDWIENDYKNGVFPIQVPKPYMTSFNFELKSIEDIVAFNNVHESLHMGIVMSLRKFI